MQARSKSSLTVSSSQSQPIPLTLRSLLVSRIGCILLFLLMAASFVTTAKVLISPLLTPVPPSQLELAPEGTEVLN